MGEIIKVSHINDLPPAKLSPQVYYKDRYCQLIEFIRPNRTGAGLELELTEGTSKNEVISLLLTVPGLLVLVEETSIIVELFDSYNEDKKESYVPQTRISTS